MSRYDALAKQAKKWFEWSEQTRQECESFLKTVMNSFKAYLGCDEKQLEFIALDQNLNFTGLMVPCSDIVPLTPGANGQWHFGIAINFPSSSSALPNRKCYKLAIIRTGETFTLRAGKEFEQAPQDGDHMTEFFEFIVASLTEELQVPRSEPKKMGFI